jgi:ubiquinone/menaquinone biosynthesis C-methylase UbiE
MVLGGKLFLAPIRDNPQRVLDIGTGTGRFIASFTASVYHGLQVDTLRPGIWAIDFAE